VNYIAQSHSDVARQNAEKFQYLPPLKPDSKHRCLEFFFDSPEVPNYVIFEGQLILSIPMRSKSSVVQIMGDDGPIYIQVKEGILQNRMKNWKIPFLSYSMLHNECAALEAALKTIKAIALYREFA
jgi:hypothetical protein